MRKDHLAKEAERLIRDDVLNHGFALMKKDAQEALAIADPDNKTEIIQLQQRIAVVNDIGDILQGFITEAGETLIRPVA